MTNASDRSLQHDKIDRLNDQAFEIRVSDSNKALTLSQKIVELARNSGYQKGFAYGLRTLGFCLMRLSRNEEALPHLQEAFSLFDFLHDIHGKGYVYETFGIIQRNFGNYQQSLEYLYQGHEWMQQSLSVEGDALSWYHIGVTYKYMGDLEKALECLLKSLSSAKVINHAIAESYSLNTIGGIYNELGDYPHALEYYHQSLTLRINFGDKWGEAGCLDNIGYVNFKLGNYNEAMDSCRKALAIAQSVEDKKGQGNSLFHLAEILQIKNDNEQAQESALESLAIRKNINDKKGQAEVYLCLAKSSDFFDHTAVSERKFDFLNKALELGHETKALDLLAKIHQAFYQSFKHGKQFEEALVHLEKFNAIEKESHTNTLNQKIQNLEISNRMEQSRKELEIFRLKNIELAALNEEIENRKAGLEKTLNELRTTQSQLIQSEKMASLGELTAGIAHEIQNPLNFVNNFSEVSQELIEELKNEKSKVRGERNEKLENELLTDIYQNLEKINHHGKRADAIVKGMLQHSRVSSGQKELTDINALCDEYFRLSYHGLRAKDKTFNSKFETDFDSSLPKINVVPQDIGRVILNLINNAFYVVNERSKRQATGYEPQVIVTTKTDGDKVFISVKDNGNGIPQNIVDKIFQPFFTTKPTGQGTGLGLSLSYDIVKAHGGELKVETNDGKGSEFIITIPC